MSLLLYHVISSFQSSISGGDSLDDHTLADSLTLSVCYFSRLYVEGDSLDDNALSDSLTLSVQQQQDLFSNQHSRRWDNEEVGVTR